MSSTSRPISARTRILGAILSVACVGLVIAGGITFVAERERVLSDVDARLRTQVSSLLTVAEISSVEPLPAPDSTDPPATAREELREGDFSTVDEYLYAAVARLVPGRNEASVAIIDGVPRYRPETLSGFDISDNEELIDRVISETEAEKTTVIGTSVTDDGALRYIAIPVTMEGDDSVGVYLRAIDLDSELETVDTSIIIFSVAALATLAATGIVGWFVVGRLLSPIRRLQETADSITLTDLGARIPTGGNDDISDVTRTVNSMLDRLEGSVDVQRQLLDDVRHELKTPITIVRGHLEMMDPADSTDVAVTRDIGIAELDRMTRLVDDIDMLANVEGDQYTMVTIDLAGLTARVGELVAVIPDHTWSLESFGRGTVEGDDDRLLQAWLQLADNAAKYSPPGTPIELGSTSENGEVQLWVRDHGPGIPPAARHRIFRRFDRAHERRTVGGSGLGLAIVDAIAKAHDGHCTVTDTPGGGVIFTIHLPVRQGSPAELPAPVRAGDVVMQREATG
ncbi:MAG TPA: HAMP domain-containing sensor histidine kinase [Microbacterium sp.]|uniref:sensor histidine kinase n=1 Tax=Microbacterium sp. TaxID=51671 RepID=UPI002C86C07F|nr:HAMP domain-containing sensor histidine kinase [Microbacterium sp.]HWI32535.1 HAMP domain-containing sensor histidine kinase [Microbacterium sp.]